VDGLATLFEEATTLDPQCRTSTLKRDGARLLARRRASRGASLRTTDQPDSGFHPLENEKNRRVPDA
jgi:hypothetical protein